MITSSSNAQVKNIIALNKKAKERREQDVFVAEGWKMFQEAPREWLKKVYVSESGSLPTRFYYKKRWNNGWINVVNPFRASIVLGTPGSGKSYDGMF